MTINSLGKYTGLIDGKCNYWFGDLDAAEEELNSDFIFVFYTQKKILYPTSDLDFITS